MFVLTLKNRDRLKLAISNALDDLPAELIHPKLKLLQRFLESPENHILETAISSRLTFYEYTQNNLDDGLLRVLRQDLHGLNLDAVNAILDFAGFNQLEDISHFDLLHFKRQALELEESITIKTPEQALFLGYIANCKKRVLPNADPQNVRPNYSNRTIKCTFPGCTKTFNRMDAMRQHFKRHKSSSDGRD